MDAVRWEEVKRIFEEALKAPPHEHPIVHTHPDTGKKALFVDPLRMWSISDLAWNESEAVLGFLNQHIAQSEFQCRHHYLVCRYGWSCSRSVSTGSVASRHSA